MDKPSTKRKHTSAIEMESLKGTKTPPEEMVRYVNVTKTLNLRVDSFEKIDDIKDKFSEFEGIEANLQKTFFIKGGFENDQVLDFERKDGSTVHMNLHFGVRFQVNIKVSWGDTTDDKLILLDVYSWDTIGDVKTKFQDKMAGTPANQWTLIYGENQLDDSQTLASYAIENDSVLHAVFLGEDEIKISVTFPNRCPIEVTLELCSTVSVLKTMIHCMGVLEADSRKLTFNGVILRNNLKLSDYNIQMGSVLYLDSLIHTTDTSTGMGIFVKTLSGKTHAVDADEELRYVSVTKTLNLRVNTFENIDDVKNKFSEFEGTETNLGKCFFTEGGFENDQEFDFVRKDGSIVHMNLRLGVRLQVNIKVSWRATTDDKLISLDVYSWDTIGDVKTKFQDKEGTPANQLTLFYNGKQLDDLQTLASYDIENHSNLNAFSLGEDKIVILVRTSSKDPMKVMVKLCSTVVNLKRMIHCMGHYAVDRQRLTFNGVLLENGQRLSDYDIVMGSELDLKFIRRYGVQIFVKTVKGRTITINAYSSDTVATLKMVIKYIDGIPEEQQRLIFAGKCLENDLMLRDLVCFGSTLLLVT